MASRIVPRAYSRRPPENALNQQRLPVWQPILTAVISSLVFFIIGLFFIPAGILILHTSNKVSELVIDYTDCTRYTENGTVTKERCSDELKNNTSAECECHINFTLKSNFSGSVFMYYGLTNFHQNHRRYIKSKNNDQMLGFLTQDPYRDCEPFDYIYTEVNNVTKKMKIVPCGAIANSLFNDELSLYNNVLQQDVPLLRTGISWPMEKVWKFNNPKTLDGNLSEAFHDYASPARWRRPVYELDTENPNNNGFLNEDLIVWMRPSGIPNLRKLYRLVDHRPQVYSDGLPAGNYTLKVKYNFPVASFRGSKYMILSTTSLLGGKNPFLGTAYIVVGSICVLLAIVFFVVHLKFDKHDVVVISTNPSLLI